MLTELYVAKPRGHLSSCSASQEHSYILETVSFLGFHNTTLPWISSIPRLFLFFTFLLPLYMDSLWSCLRSFSLFLSLLSSHVVSFIPLVLKTISLWLSQLCFQYKSPCKFCIVKDLLDTSPWNIKASQPQHLTLPCQQSSFFQQVALSTHCSDQGNHPLMPFFSLLFLDSI